MPPSFKRVPAIDKCFAILELLAQSKEPMGISSIAGKLDLNKSTVFNIVHTLMDLNVLENQADGKFVFGTRTKLSAFLGFRSDGHVILIDKVDSAYGIKLSSEIGMRMPVLAGAGIKAMLSQLSDEEIDEILARTELKSYTPHSIIDKGVYKEEILEVRRQGIAYDREEYIEGMVAFAIPIKANGRDLQAAIWAVGMTRQVPEASIPALTELLKGVSEEINYRLQ
jgi:IclR family KDG regulon transcriptional repressor